MFSRLHFFIFIIIILIFGYLFYLNPEQIEFTLYQDYTLTISPALIAFAAFFIGAFFVFLVTLFIDTKRAFDLWRSSKRQRKEEFLQERYSQALEQMLKGNFAKAQEGLQKVLAKNDQHLPAYLSLANLYHLEGKYEQAIEILIKAKALAPENLEILFALEKNYRARHDYDLALETLEYIIAHDPENREALRKKREILLQQGEWSAAYETQKQIVKYTKEKELAETEKKFLIGLEYKFGEELAQKGNFKEAEKAMREIIKEDRNFIPAFVTLGDICQRLGDSEEASQIWRKALDTSGNPVFLERLEGLYLAQANPQKILEIYHEALRKRPEDTVLRFFYSRLLVRMEMIDEALAQLRELEISGASFPELFILMGQALHRRGDTSSAIDSYEKALDALKVSLPPYTCSICAQTKGEWSSYCEGCKNWGTFTVKLPEAARIVPAIPFYNYPVNF
jgi:lipopolysaccharide biosynthesis regulator YciM